MHPDPYPRRAWWAALVAFAASLAVLGLVAVLARGLDLRNEVARTGDPLARTADALAARVDPAAVGKARAALERAGVPARLVDSAGRAKLQTGGSPSVWGAPSAAWPGALATAGAGAWSLRDGAVEARRPLASGGAVVLRAPLAPDAGTIGAPAWPVAGLILLLSAICAGIAWWRAARAESRLRRLVAASDAAAAGRPGVVAIEGGGGWRRLSSAVAAHAARTADLQAAAEARVEALGAALSPLAHPVAARTPAGGLIRNEALERLVATLDPVDRTRVEDAVQAGLAASGPVSRRLALGDGRALEVDAWAVPGGRLVAVADRTEQARLAQMRRQVTGAAARHLQAPVSEVQALGSDLLAQVPAASAPGVRRILAAADRMERLVRQLLRGTDNDPRGRPLRLRALGASGIAYGLGTAFDERLRDRGLRLETSLPADLPPVRTDPALVHEILSELIANSATFTPRGGTITLSGRALPGGGVELAVTDTGPGVAGEELHLVTERFARGSGAAGFPGAGLGLGVAAALAERLGGRLTIGAGPGGRARLELLGAPAARPEAAATEQAITGAPAASP